MSKKYSNKRNTAAKKPDLQSKSQKGTAKVSRGRKDTEPQPVDKQYNDPAWRLPGGPLGEQLHQYSFNQFLGVPVDMAHGLLSSSRFTADPKQTVPSIAVLRLNPSPGDTGSTLTPGSSMLAAINKQGLRTFTALSAGNAKTTNYAPQDVTTLLLALGEVISMFEYARRAIGMATVYSLRNRDYPKNAIDSTGIDAADLIKNLAKYRIQFNLLTVQANKIPFPANIRYFEACYSLYRDVFVDEMNNPMAQSMIYVPYSTWVLDETTNPNGSQLSTIDLTTYNSNPPSGVPYLYFSDVLQIIETQLNALMTSSTLNYVYSDVLRLAEKQNVPMVHIDGVAEDYVVMPTYSSEAMINIENATIIGAPMATLPSGTTSFTVGNDVVHDPNTNCVNWHPMFRATVPGITAPRIMNFDHDNPTLDERVSGTRFMCTALVDPFDDTAEEFWHGVFTPDHYVVDVKLYYVGTNGAFTSTGFSYTGATLSNAGVYDRLSKFHHIPKFYLYSASGSGANKKFTYQGCFGDLAYWTTLDYRTLRAIQDGSFYELFELK